MTAHTSVMTDRRSGMIQSLGYPQTSTIVSRAVAAAAANNHHHSTSTRRGGRSSKRYSVSAFYSMAAEQDVEVEDELAQGKTFISHLSFFVTRFIQIKGKKPFF